MRKRYFKEGQGQPKDFEQKHFVNEIKCQDTARDSRCKVSNYRGCKIMAGQQTMSGQNAELMDHLHYRLNFDLDTDFITA